MKASELSCKDLMVGDWVHLIRESNKIKDEWEITQVSPQRITSIMTDTDNPCIQTDATDAYYGEESYRPIPLTAEILEKNGFKQLEEDSYICKKSDKEGDYSIVVDLLVPYLSYIRKDKMPKASYGGEIKFVHQLQHALRLAGIDKEIIL